MVHPELFSAFGNTRGIPAVCELYLSDIMRTVSHSIKLLVVHGLANASAPAPWVKCTTQKCLPKTSV